MNTIILECGKFVMIVLLILLLLLLCLSAYHHLMLRTDKKGIVPNGNMVDLNGRKIHVYTQGKQSSGPTLVFLAGSATVAPVYDFKSVYGKLSNQYRIIVVEKTGYGYSDIAETDRDIASIVEEERSVLCAIGEHGPYILVPHSMGGLEAIYWAQHYPEDVQGMIGLDMAVPEVYEKMNLKASLTTMKLLRAVCFLGLQRIPRIYPLNTEDLNDDEKEQQKLLLFNYSINKNFRCESEKVKTNAETVKEGGEIYIPLLMFLSNGSEIGDFWISCEQKFAKENQGKIIQFHCGHYIHHYESKKIAEEIKKFMIEFH